MGCERVWKNSNADGGRRLDACGTRRGRGATPVVVVVGMIVADGVSGWGEGSSSDSFRFSLLFSPVEVAPGDGCLRGAGFWVSSVFGGLVEYYLLYLIMF